MKKLLILLLILILLTGCLPNGSSTFSFDCSQWSSFGVQRCVDQQQGYVCYLRSSQGIWCGKLAQ